MTDEKLETVTEEVLETEPAKKKVKKTPEAKKLKKIQYGEKYSFLKKLTT